MSRSRLSLLAAVLVLCSAPPCHAQFKTELVNQDGATAPCTGIGPGGGPLAKKCVEMFEQAGFVRTDQAGISGLTITDTGKIDAVAPNSAAAQAGLMAGDVVVSVAGKSVVPTPGTVATKAIFGDRGTTVSMTVRRAGTDLPMFVLREAATAPPGPKSPNIFVMVKPLVDWRGQFAPCMGAGPAAPAAFEFCDHHFKPFGFIKMGQYGSTGLVLDTDRKEGAFVTAVNPDSGAQKAGMQAGDEIVAIEGKPLASNVGQSANEMIFGKAGEHRLVKVLRGQDEKTIDLQLAAKPQS